MDSQLLARIGQALGGAAQGAYNPGQGIGAIMARLTRRRSQGANLPQTPYHFPVPDPGFQPAQPRFPGDPGIDPGMTPPPDNSPFGPVHLGGAQAFPMQPMTPGGFGTLPNTPNIGPGMPNDQGMQPGLRRPKKRFDFSGGTGGY